MNQPSTPPFGPPCEATPLNHMTSLLSLAIRLPSLLEHFVEDSCHVQ